MSTNTMLRSQSNITEKQVIDLVAEALGVSANNLNSDSIAEDFTEWDSMGMLAILAVLARTGLHLDPGEVTGLVSMQGIFNMFREAGVLV